MKYIELHSAGNGNHISFNIDRITSYEPYEKDNSKTVINFGDIGYRLVNETYEQVKRKVELASITITYPYPYSYMTYTKKDINTIKSHWLNWEKNYFETHQSEWENSENDECTL